MARILKLVFRMQSVDIWVGLLPCGGSPAGRLVEKKKKEKLHINFCMYDKLDWPFRLPTVCVCNLHILA